MAVNGPALGATGVGLLLVWSGIRGKKVSDALRYVITGKDPTVLPQHDPIAISTGSPTGGGNTGSVGVGPESDIAANFMRYVGVVPYKWAGANPHRGWDCSGSCNYVVNRDSNRRIPGYKPGTFTGQTHGPNTLVWLAWPGKVAIARHMVAAGDMIIWQTHMGVAVSNSHYASAYDTQDGTCVKPIRGGGPIGEVATFWRLK